MKIAWKLRPDCPYFWCCWIALSLFFGPPLSLACTDKSLLELTDDDSFFRCKEIRFWRPVLAVTGCTRNSLVEILQAKTIGRQETDLQPDHRSGSKFSGQLQGRDDVPVYKCTHTQALARLQTCACSHVCTHACAHLTGQTRMNGEYVCIHQQSSVRSTCPYSPAV